MWLNDTSNCPKLAKAASESGRLPDRPFDDRLTAETVQPSAHATPNHVQWDAFADSQFVVMFQFEPPVAWNRSVSAVRSAVSRLAEQLAPSPVVFVPRSICLGDGNGCFASRVDIVDKART